MDTSIVPICYTMTPSCYYNAASSALHDLFRWYLWVSAHVILPALCGILLAFLGFLIVDNCLLEKETPPLTSFEEEMMQYIYENASTGCTARMIHASSTDDSLSLSQVENTLVRLQKRGLIMPTKATLWVGTGN